MDAIDPNIRLGLLGLGAVVVAIIIAWLFGPRWKNREQISARRFEITHSPTGGRIFFSICFWLWGIVYGGFCLFSLAGAEAQASLGIGTSAAVTMRLTFWIGGLLLFGIGALLGGTHSTMRIHDPAPPDQGA